MTTLYRATQCFNGVKRCLGLCPVVPPPLPTTESESDPGSATFKYVVRPYCIRNTLKFTSIILCFVFIFSIPYILSSDFANFKIESTTVALDENDISNNQSRSIKATWEIGFSVKNLGTNLSVSVRCMSSNWSTNSIKNVGNTTSFNEIVIVPLPREFVLNEVTMSRGLTLQYDVLFRTNRGIDQVEGNCKNMTIAISSNVTKGMMVGGPRMCRVHGRI
ncbi:hypothetical protein CASFOL_020272 [Castilleja foliolosa]|uniref:Late embryogenesis abundant protein LEA-2 subgroup domain-containing protein n=1 Tax=Castilleja foliolosa TaxID=1961234 RepID=A0ABD3D443_9LAMI